MARDVLIIASSYMSRSEQAVIAKKVFMAIHKIRYPDPEGLYHVVREYGITSCGFSTTVAILST